MLALRWHPDRNPQDAFAAERFREALDAYENLIDPSRRGHYDQVRRHKGSRTKTRHHERRPGAQRVSSYTVEEILSELFGFDTHHARQHRRNDLRFDLQIPRSAAVHGTLEEIIFHRWVFCRACMGNGNRTAVLNLLAVPWCGRTGGVAYAQGLDSCRQSAGGPVADHR